MSSSNQQRKAQPLTCYACNALATEDEHAPPKCIFPKGEEYRRSLIKVPSCVKHNSQKSRNDELLRHVLVTAPRTNELAVKVLTESALPALERRPHILSTFFPKLAPLQIGNRDTASYRVDLKRFNLSIRTIVRALYFFENGKKLHADLDVVWGALGTQDRRRFPYFEIIMRAEQTAPPMLGGANPRVFRYAFNLSRDRRATICRLQFYEGIPIYAMWRNA